MQTKKTKAPKVSITVETSNRAIMPLLDFARQDEFKKPTESWEVFECRCQKLVSSIAYWHSLSQDTTNINFQNNGEVMVADMYEFFADIAESIVIEAMSGTDEMFSSTHLIQCLGGELSEITSRAADEMIFYYAK